MSVKLLKKPSSEQIEAICIAAEEAVRGFLLNRVPQKLISEMNIKMDATGDKPLQLSIDVSLSLATAGLDGQKIVDEATEIAFSAAESKAKELRLCSSSKR